MEKNGDAQRRATAKYQREKCTTVSIRFFPSDKALLEHLGRQENKAGYIKALIARDINEKKRA